MSEEDEGSPAVNNDSVNEYNDNSGNNNAPILIESNSNSNDSNNSNNGSKSSKSNNNNITSACATPKSILSNFLLFSLLFSLNHGGVVSCLSLATARLGGSLGSYQSCALYGSYTLSALLGTTYAVRRLGGAGKGAVVLGMCFYCAYAGCFAVATIMAGDDDNDDDNNNDDENDNGNGNGHGNGNDGAWRKIVVIVGGLLGGVGGGFLWTAQGSYFAQVSAEYAKAASDAINGDDGNGGECQAVVTTVEDASKDLGGLFAAIYLTGELAMRLFSTVVVATFGWSWKDVFLGYTAISLVSTLLMSTLVTSYGDEDNQEVQGQYVPNDALHKITSTWRLLITDYRMKYMVPICGVFALTSSFFTSFVNGEVLILALQDTNTVYVGLLGSVTSATAALSSILFASLAQRTGNTTVLAIGCAAFALTSLLFLTSPQLDNWGVGGLLVVYGLQGVGRATFEGNLRAEFAVVFGAHEREGAFGNIVLWNGSVSVVGFLLAAAVRCGEVGDYCVEYQDGSLHGVLLYEVLVLVGAALAVGGLGRVSYLGRLEEKRAVQASFNLDAEHSVQ